MPTMLGNAAVALGVARTAIDEAVELTRAVDHVHAAVGSAGMLEGRHPFARQPCDVYTITQRALCSAARFESMDQVMLGLETDWVLFNI